jgi:methionyl-tRNA formyltransferase
VSAVSSSTDSSTPSSAAPATAVVFAYHEVGLRCMEVLLAQGVRVRLLLTHEDDPKEQVWFGSVAALAAKHGIPTLTPDDPNTPDLIERVRALAPDFIFSFYYRRMLSPALLALAKHGAFNMHGSLLPQFRGRVPVNWAVIKGATQTGATLHEMVEKPDAGRIVDQQAVSIGPDDLAVDVFRRVTAASAAVLARALPRLLDGSAELKPQDLASGSYFSGRKPEDGRIDWSQPARDIHNLVRGVAPPYPGAFTRVEGAPLRILRTKIEAGRAARPGGAGLYCDGGAYYADCSDGGVLRLLEVEGAPEPAKIGARKLQFN